VASDPRYRNGHRRRQLRQRLLRSTSTCAVCGGELDKTIPPHHPDSVEVHERIPVAADGDPLSRANTVAVHSRCNKAEWQRWVKVQQAPVTFVTSRRW
jgi:5-methylcytosine-specific restriction endonuclease McrA